MTACSRYGDLLGGYVLGALEPAERDAMRRHLESCADCRREHAELAGIPELLDRVEPADVPPPEPSAWLEDAILDRFARERRRRGGVRLRRSRAAVLVAALVAAAAAVAVIGIVVSRTEEPAYADGRLRGTPGAGGTFEVEEVPAGTAVSLDVHGLPPRDAYEVWCVRTDGRWVSGGTFHPGRDGGAEAQLTAAVRPGDYHVVVVTRGVAERTAPKRRPEVLRGELQY